jgi:hypothetical protein
LTSLPRPRTTIERATAFSTAALIDGGSLQQGSTSVDAGCPVLWDPALAQEDITVDGTVASTAGSTNNGVRSNAARTHGRHYFEVVFESLGDASFNEVSVVADDPVGTTDPSFFDEIGCGVSVGHCAALTNFNAGDVISVIADLDTGRVDFAVNGSLTAGDALDGFSPRALAIVPGAGPFRAGVTLGDGARARANFGAEPFAYAPPEGFTAWGNGLAVDDNGACVSEAPLPLTKANVTVLADCDAGNNVTSVDTGVDVGDGPALAMFGIYEPTESGNVDVTVSRPGRYVVVLGSYSSTNWSVHAGEGVTIDRVIARSYEGVTVDAPDGVDVDTSAFVEGEDAGYVSGHAWPYSFGGSDTVGFVGNAEQVTGLSLSYFAGTYRTDTMELLPDGVTPTECR